MLYKLIALSVVFGLVVADPVAKLSEPSIDDLEYGSPLTDRSRSYEVVDIVKPDPSSVFIDVITTLIGYKVSAITLAVKVIDWLITNSVLIAFGAIATLGFCKLTDKCSLSYATYAPLPLHSLVTPEHLETAEQFLLSAMEKYVKTRGGKALK